MRHTLHHISLVESLGVWSDEDKGKLLTDLSNIMVLKSKVWIAEDEKEKGGDWERGER